MQDEMTSKFRMVISMLWLKKLAISRVENEDEVGGASEGILSTFISELEFWLTFLSDNSPTFLLILSTFEVHSALLCIYELLSSTILLAFCQLDHSPTFLLRDFNIHVDNPSDLMAALYC